MLPHLGRDTGGYMRHGWDAYQRRSATIQGNYGTLQDRVGMVSGGAGGTRTPDFLRAREALSQLSYSPTESGGQPLLREGRCKRKGAGTCPTPLALTAGQ